MRETVFLCLIALSNYYYIIRATKPKTLLKLSSSLIFRAITASSEHKLEVDVLNNGVSYFTGSLLNWTLVGVIKALLREILQKEYVLL